MKYFVDFIFKKIHHYLCTYCPKDLLAKKKIYLITYYYIQFSILLSGRLRK